jgi:hypothetical protein
LRQDKRVIAGAFLFGVAVWGTAGFFVNGLNGTLVSLGGLAVLSSFAHSFSAAWTYLTTSGISPDVSIGLAKYAKEKYPSNGAPSDGRNFIDVILRDWLIGHGYLELQSDGEDAN